MFLLLDQIQRPVSQWVIDLGEGWQFSRRYQHFYLEKKIIVHQKKYFLGENERFFLSDNETIALRRSDTVADKGVYQVPLPLTVKLPLTIRRRQDGDRIRLTETLTKRISRYFIDKKTPMDIRDQAWVVEDSAGEIVALLPFVNSYLSIATETDRIHYILDYTPQVAK